MPPRASGSLSITEITSPVVTDLGVGPTIAATQIGGSAGLEAADLEPR